MIKWHSKKGTQYPEWYAEINGKIIAYATMTGVPNRDNYPWDFYIEVSNKT